MTPALGMRAGKRPSIVRAVPVHAGEIDRIRTNATRCVALNPSLPGLPTARPGYRAISVTKYDGDRYLCGGAWPVIRSNEGGVRDAKIRGSGSDSGPGLVWVLTVCFAWDGGVGGWLRCSVCICILSGSVEVTDS